MVAGAQPQAPTTFGATPLKEVNEFADVDYFNCVEMLVKLVLRVEPIEFTAAIITTEMPAAIRPYSIAVAPESSFKRL